MQLWDCVFESDTGIFNSNLTEFAAARLLVIVMYLIKAPQC